MEYKFFLYCTKTKGMCNEITSFRHHPENYILIVSYLSSVSIPLTYFINKQIKVERKQ